MNAEITHAEMELLAMMELESLRALVHQVQDTHSRTVMVRYCIFDWLRMTSPKVSIVHLAVSRWKLSKENE